MPKWNGSSLDLEEEPSLNQVIYLGFLSFPAAEGKIQTTRISYKKYFNVIGDQPDGCKTVLHVLKLVAFRRGDKSCGENDEHANRVRTNSMV